MMIIIKEEKIDSDPDCIVIDLVSLIVLEYYLITSRGTSWSLIARTGPVPIVSVLLQAVSSDVNERAALALSEKLLRFL